MKDRSEDSIQFEQAEYSQDANQDARSCTVCSGALGIEYFLANGHVVCERCALKMKFQFASGSRLGRFGKATVLGLVAGALGAALFFAILKLTGYEFGLIAIVVGFLVGAAVRYGNGGRGGWPYQALAIAITYAAIVLTYVPFIVQGFNAQTSTALEQDSSKVAKVTVLRNQSVLLNGKTVTMDALDAKLKRVSEAGGQGWYYREGMTSEAPGPAADRVAAIFSKHGLRLMTFKDPQFSEREHWSDEFARSTVGRKVAVSAIIFGLAAAAPFLGLPKNIIGLAIIAIALFEAWKLNKRATGDLKGPFQISALTEK